MPLHMTTTNLQLGLMQLTVEVKQFFGLWGVFLSSIDLNIDVQMITKTNLHLVHDGICAQDVVLLFRISLCMFHSPCGLSTGRKANHHKDLTQVNGNNGLTLLILDCTIINYSIKMLMILFFQLSFRHHKVSPTSHSDLVAGPLVPRILSSISRS